MSRHAFMVVELEVIEHVYRIVAPTEAAARIIARATSDGEAQAHNSMARTIVRSGRWPRGKTYTR